MNSNYTDEINIQILIALLKGHGIRKVIASPGTTNMTFVKSLQNDAFFDIYSSIDERSAAYMACGLASETGEAVVLSCTGATASRNYMSGLTEAFYRKLPILAVTSSQVISKVGHHIPQIIDRNNLLRDVVRYSVHLPLVKDKDDWWNCEVKGNTAVLELTRRGGGPVHINLETGYSQSFVTKELPKVRLIRRITELSQCPPLYNCKVGVFVGTHVKMTEEEINALDRFCESNNSVVFCDHTSGYKSKYCLIHSLSSSQRLISYNELRPDLLIHIGEVSGDYSAHNIAGKHVWRVSRDGELRDTFGKLQYIFEMSELEFFTHYTKDNISSNHYMQKWQKHLEGLYNKIPVLPFSNLWIARKIHSRIPRNSTIHFGILNSLRSWNFFTLPKTVDSYSNVGGFGIDGCLSSLIGASLSDKDKLYFAVIGDLAFFYDMNSIGNRHVANNLRILLINNGTGIEFKNFNHPAAEFGESADGYIAGAGHFGQMSPTLVKNYCESLGFEYLTASNKKEFNQVYKRFISSEKSLNKPILLEVFTDSKQESQALEIITSISSDLKNDIKKSIKDIIGKDNLRKIKKYLPK